MTVVCVGQRFHMGNSCFKATAAQDAPAAKGGPTGAIGGILHGSAQGDDRITDLQSEIERSTRLGL